MLEHLVDGIWTEEAPQRFMGLDMGTRMTVVRLEDGGLLLYASIAATDERKAAVAALGRVEVVVCPNCFHHLYAGEWIDVAPQAKLWAPKGLAEKRPDLRIDHVLGDEDPPWVAGCQPIAVPGMPQMQETVLWHAGTRTLIAADLFQNYDRSPGGLWTTLYFTLAGLTHGPTVSRPIRLGYRDRPALRELVERLIALDPQRIVVCHGGVVTENATQALQTAFAWLPG